MAKANLTLPNGLVVAIEGTTEEIQALLAFYGDGTSQTNAAKPKPKTKARPAKRATRKVAKTIEDTDSGKPDLSQIVAFAKDCEEAAAIERQILDRTSQVDRTLMPLYIVHEHFNNDPGLTSGEISKITTELGVPVAGPNVSNTLSGIASKYVIGDAIRRRGHVVRYKLSRRGVKYMKSVIQGTSSEDEK